MTDLEEHHDVTALLNIRSMTSESTEESLINVIGKVERCNANRSVVTPFWLYLTQHIPWSLENYCRNFKLLSVFCDDLRLQKTQWTSGTLFVLMEYFWTKPE